MDNSKQIFIDSGRAMLRFLLRRRWFYILLALVLGGLYYTLRRDTPVAPTREYITTYRIKYSNDKEGQLFNKTNNLHWQMVNPYDYAIAAKYFESTKLIDEAGSAINYTVNYYTQGRDIYATRPVEVRFLSKDITIFDAWTMKLRLDESGVEVSKLKGYYKQAKIGDKATFHLEYDKICDSPVGKVLVKRLQTDSPIKNILLKKMSDVDAQKKYDNNMKRHTSSGSLIEMFLTADCTPEFAHDLFTEIGKCYNAYARQTYKEELNLYLGRLAKAKAELRSGQFSFADSLMNKSNASPEAIKKMLGHIEDLEEEAQTNALILSQSDVLEVIDNNYIRKPKQSINPRAYFKYLATLLVLILPLFFIFLECFLRKLVLSRFTLPKEWLDKNNVFQLPKIKSQRDWAIFRLLLDKQLGAGDKQIFLLSAEDEGKAKTAFIEPLSKSLNKAGKSLEVQSVQSLSEAKTITDKEQKTNYLLLLLPSVFEESLAVELQQHLGKELFIMLSPAQRSHKEIEHFAEQSSHLNLQPNILWLEQI